MATISIDYDSEGDVELILEKTENASKTSKPITRHVGNSAHTEQTDDAPSPPPKQEDSTKYTVGPISIKVNKFRLRVSSLKLISSSPYFQAMLQGSGFREHQELREHGFVAIELLGSEDDPTAMMIILGILYENNVDVPHDVDFSTLYNVAILVDKYQWHALVTPYGTSWFEKLVASPGLPDTFDETLLKWLWIAWLFGMKDHFKSLSRVAQQDVSNSIDVTDERIRLPTRALNAINEQRKVAFQKIEETFEKFRLVLLDREDQKGSVLPEQILLRHMVFGYSTFYSQDLELGEFAAPDYAGRSIRWLRKRIETTLSMEGFTVKAPDDGKERFITPNGGWDLKYKLQEAIKELRMDDWGLAYDDFKVLLHSNRLDEISNLG